MSRRPIGVFDSGVGGLTVFRALAVRMPRESLVYFGDTAHVPYGNKSREAVTRYSLAAGRFLAGLGVKLLVVACNTASALALGPLKRTLRIPVIGVIDPGVRAAVAATRRGRIGVIATEATIASRAYEMALRRARPGVRVIGAACPLLVPLVEEGWWSHPVTRQVAAEYLRPIKRAGVDTLILGCTHYPLLKSVLAKTAGPRVRCVDSAEAVAAEVEALCEKRAISLPRAGAPARGSRRFYASDGPQRFRKLARRFLGATAGPVSIHRLD